MNKPPSFFTFFKAGEDDNELRIPIAFNQCIDEPLPEEVYLRDRNNIVWTVKVAKKGDYWFFVDGWNKFVKDNLLKSMDLLAFIYFSKNLFNFKLYGSEATEKNIDGPSGMRGVETVQTSESDDDNDNDEKTESDTDEHIQVVGTNANNDENGGQLPAARYLYGKCYGMEIFEAGLAERPAGPYFVAKLNPKRVSDLFIPADVIKDYDLALDEEITLVDPRGREFPSNCRKWGDGRYVISGGWVSLCRVNEVDEETRCICEFVEAHQRQLLHMSFVRI